MRLVLDLRHVNEYLKFPKFKYEDLKTATKLLDQDYYFSTFDLKSGYHHIPIHEEDRQYLGFAWEFPDGRIRYFQFLVLPFGLASACYAFTKLTKPLIKKWRKEGIRCTMYLDDGIFGEKEYKQCKKHSYIVQNDLNKAGLTVNRKKSNFKPSKSGKWLGFEINTTKMIFSVPSEKINKLLVQIKRLLIQELVNAKQISKIAGHLISMTLAIGPLTRLFTRQMYRFIESRSSWYEFTVLDYLLKEELTFWERNLEKNNGFHIKKNYHTSKIVYSDASGSGYGGYVVQKLGNIVARGDFNSHERHTSSTYRELLAVKLILQSFRLELKNESVQWFSDNNNVSRIIEVGSSRPHLHKLAIEIFDICISHDINLQSTWIPREENVIADTLSKTVDSDNWSIDCESFEYIQSHFGEFTFDRFSDDLNKKVACFNSKFHCPSSSGVNAFTLHWGDKFNWLCPPINLVGNVLKHMKLCNARGVLFVPMWHSSYFWPLITSDGQYFNDFVKDYLLLDPFFHNNARCKSVFEGFAKFKSIALLIDFL